MEGTVEAKWTLVDEACEGGKQIFHYKGNAETLPERFSSLKQQSNAYLTEWMNKKKMAVEEIDVLEEKIPDTDDEEEEEPAKKQKIEK